MAGRIVFRIVMALVLIAALAGLGFFAYNAGLNQGLAGAALATDGKAVPAPYAAGPVMAHGWGWGWGMGFGLGILGFLRCLVPLFLICLVFGAFRGLFFGGWMHRRGMWRHHGPWHWNEGEVPPAVQEWHRKMHETGPDQPKES